MEKFKNVFVNWKACCSFARSQTNLGPQFSYEGVGGGRKVFGLHSVEAANGGKFEWGTGAEEKALHRHLPL